MPDETGEPVVNYARVPTFCTRGCGCIGHPAFPAPSCLSRALISRNPGRHRAIAPRERAAIFSPLPVATLSDLAGKESPVSGLRLIGDIGGTNARFAVAEGGKY